MRPQYLKILKGVIAVAAFVLLCYKAPIKINLGGIPSVQIGEESSALQVEEKKQEANALVSETEESTKHVAVGLPSLNQAITEHNSCRLGAITAYGAGIVIFGDNGYSCCSIPDGLSRIVKDLRSRKKVIDDIVLTKSGYYCCVYDRNGWSGKIPSGMREKLNEYNKAREKILSISVSENGKYVIVTDKHYHASDHENNKFIEETRQKNKNKFVKSVCVTDRGICVILGDGTIRCQGTAKHLIQEMEGIPFWPDRIVFTDYDTYLMTSKDGRCRRKI